MQKLTGILLFVALSLGLVVSTGRSLRGEGEELSGADLSGSFIPEVDLKSARLGGADLSGANLAQARAPFATMENANLAGRVARDRDL